MIPAQLGSLLIRVAIVCGPEEAGLGDSLETLLKEEKAFTFARFEYRSESGIKPHAAGFSDPDVVVGALGAFQETKTDLLVASLRRAFPHRSVVVTTTHPDT